MTSPDEPEITTTAAKNVVHVARSASKSASGGPNGSVGTNFPPPKTDKPRPHVCTTCTRSFARLEHLKRHERSHTKEKPFECPECTRCFARRDLLLRHQQKLHSTTTPSSRPRTGRRESAVGSGRVRKNSVVNNTSSTSMRPRANTLGHLDLNALDLLTTSDNINRNINLSQSQGNNDMSAPGVSGYQFRGMSSVPHGSIHNLPRLNTSALPTDHAGGLRTAPVYGTFPNELSMSTFAFSPGNTINPNQLHMADMQDFGMDHAGSLQYPHLGPSNMPMLQDGDTPEWMVPELGGQGFFCPNNESAIETSSPSAMDTNSPDAMGENLMDRAPPLIHALPGSVPQVWGPPFVPQTHTMVSPLNLEFPSSVFNDMVPAPHGTISPKSLLAQGGSMLDIDLPSPQHLSNMEPPTIIPGFVAPGFHMGTAMSAGASTASPCSMDSGLRHSSITSFSTDLINENIRSSILTTFLHCSSFGQRPYSQAAAGSPFTPNLINGGRETFLNNFPSTSDLQHYFAAYVQYFHPHLPFLHLPSLSFESSSYSISSRSTNTEAHNDHISISGGGGCLMLAITAIGALYERETVHSKQLFDAAKHMIGRCLEERRRANLSRSGFEPRHQAEAETTPLWLVQAMLLNVIYGYNSGDKTSAEIASNHCATLVSLTRGAELARPYPGYLVMANGTLSSEMQVNALGPNGWNPIMAVSDDSDWQEWKIVEERKRTLYAVFVLSSLLVSAYNHPPALTNSEIRLTLPCEEHLWEAENAAIWRSMGGASAAEAHPIMFNAALGHLLTASQRQSHQPRSSDAPFGLGIRMENLPESDLKPSTFGCLILINALHNYIWETRQRHLGHQWTNHDTEQMHAHIEPALRAWQAAWASNPTHSLERPNPFGAGPLSADCIPLLDLAYVRLFVNLGRSKEAFWQRDYDTMADGLAPTLDLLDQTAQSPSSSYDELSAIAPSRLSSGRHDGAVEPPTADLGTYKDFGSDAANIMAALDKMPQDEQMTTRERHLRKAAFYAADSLTMSDRLGASFVEHTSRELPLQSAICTYDCAQVLAEWISTVQDRLGRYVGIINGGDTDPSYTGRLSLLGEEDRNLLDKIGHVLNNADLTPIPNSESSNAGHLSAGSRILLTIAQTLERAAVWPVTSLMARSLQTQAERMKDRALASVALLS